MRGRTLETGVAAVGLCSVHCPLLAPTQVVVSSGRANSLKVGAALKIPRVQSIGPLAVGQMLSAVGEVLFLQNRRIAECINSIRNYPLNAS